MITADYKPRSERMSAGLDGGVCVEMSGVDEMCGGFDNKAVSIHWLQ